MRKPNAEEVKSGNGNNWTPVEVGGHYMKIMSVENYQSKTGKPMIKVMFDFDSNDKQPGYFTEQYKNDDRADKKWPFAATKYVMIDDYNDSSKYSRDFMSFINSVEHSNTGFQTNWDAPDFVGQFKGKKIGGVFGIVESEYNGNVRKRAELRWFCGIESVADVNIPEEKLLQGSKPSSIASDDDFLDVPNDLGELPFN